MRVVQPVDFIDQLVGFDTETDGLDVQVSETLVLRVADKVLGLNGHEFRVKPGAEQLTVEGLVPFVVVHLIGSF